MPGLNPLDQSTWPKTGNPHLDRAVVTGARRAAGHVLGGMNPALSDMLGTVFNTAVSAAAQAAVMANPTATPAGPKGAVGRFMQDLANLESGVIPILGAKGGGKTGLGFKLNEMWAGRRRPIFVVGIVQQLLTPFGYYELDPDNVRDIPKNAVVLLIDDAGESFGTDDYGTEASKKLKKFLIITRHKDAIVVWNNISSALVNKHMLNADVFFFKPSSKIGREQERPEIRGLIRDADAAFAGLTTDQQKGAAYVFSEPLHFEGLIHYGLPKGWSQQLSKNKA